VSYFADADLTERLRGTNVTPLSGEISAARAFSEGYVDAALMARHTVPFSPVPDVIKYLALDIAAYEVLTKHFAVEDPNVGDLIKQFWLRAMETIERLQSGQLALSDGAGVLASKTVEDIIMTGDATEEW